MAQSRFDVRIGWEAARGGSQSQSGQNDQGGGEASGAAASGTLTIGDAAQDVGAHSGFFCVRLDASVRLAPF